MFQSSRDQAFEVSAILLIQACYDFKRSLLLVFVDVPDPKMKGNFANKERSFQDVDYFIASTGIEKVSLSDFKSQLQNSPS